MPLSRDEIEALDPTDPADAAILADEAVYYVDQTADLESAVEVTTQTVRRARVEANLPARKAAMAKRNRWPT